jgi:hypothetical protein
VGAVVVVVGVVVVVVLPAVPDVEPELDVDGVVVDGVVVAVVAEVVEVTEWVVPSAWADASEATRTPSPTAAAVAPTATVAVTRRTRATARSRVDASGGRWPLWWDLGAMSYLSFDWVRSSTGSRLVDRRLEPVHRTGRRTSPVPAVGRL